MKFNRPTILTILSLLLLNLAVGDAAIVTTTGGGGSVSSDNVAFTGGNNGAFLTRDSTQPNGANWSSVYAGPYSIATTVNTSHLLLLAGTYAPSGSSIGNAFRVNTTLSPATAMELHTISVGGVFTEAASGGPHPLISAIHTSPTVTAGAANVTTLAGLSTGPLTAQTTTTNAAQIYISAAPTGATNNYSLWSDAGLNRFDGPVQLGAATLTLTDGAFGMSKMTASASAPGAGGSKLEVVCGTNAGTAKLIMYAGTSATAVTIVDNVGTGVTGC